MAKDPEWRKKEPSLKEIIAKYPTLPKSFILKVDVFRRGRIFTEAAKKLADPKIHQLVKEKPFDSNSDWEPAGLIMRDGSILVAGSGRDFDFNKTQRDPYVIDVVDGKVYITDEGEVLEEVEYWEKPDFYDKLASNGKPLQTYATARPQRLDIQLSSYCHFWDTPGEGCKYCAYTPNFNLSGQKEYVKDIKYIREAVAEALKQKGRYSAIMLVGGSILSGRELFDDEVDGYIELLQMIGEFFEPGKRFPSQLISSAFNEKQLEKIYNNTGIMTYTPDIEVLNEEKFNWICAGKANKVGYEEWKRRAYKAVEIFGWGNVDSGLCFGVELAKPYGFATEDEAFEAVVEQAEELAVHGVSLGANVWRNTPHTVFQDQVTPSLDYFIRSYKAFDELHHKYKLGRFVDDYRRCGMHPGLDLARI